MPIRAGSRQRHNHVHKGVCCRAVSGHQWHTLNKGVCCVVEYWLIVTIMIRVI